MSFIWIVGASSGIGAEVARQYAKDGHKVLVSARSHDKLAELADDLENTTALAFDVADQDGSVKAVGDVIAQHGLPDIVLLCAAVWHPMGIDNFDRDKIVQSVNVNYVGVINIIAELLPHWTRERRGHLAVVSSVAGYRGLPNSIAYAPTKAALINLCEGLKTQLEPFNVDVSMVTPGFVDTPMTKENDFPMPGIISTQEAAQYIKKGLDQKKFEISFPPLFSFVMQIIRTMPNWLFFVIARKMLPQKQG